MSEKRKNGKKQIVIWMLLLFMLAASAVPTVASAAAAKGFVTIKKNLYYIKKNGENAIGWLTKSGKTYYFNEDGKAAKGLTTIGKKTYYFSKDGVMQTGWQSIGKKWAYFKKRSGVMAKNTKIDGIKIKKNGYAAPTAVQKKQLKAQKKAEEVVASITKDSMSKSQKLRACYNYMTSSRFHYVRKAFSAYSGWEYDYAYQMLTSSGGNCYNFACAFAMMAKTIGYESYVVRGRIPSISGGLTPHCLVKISGKYYDPEGDWAGFVHGVYGVSSYPMTLVIDASRKI